MAEFVYTVTVSAPDDSNGAELGVMLESGINKAIGGEVDNITVEEAGSGDKKKPKDPLLGDVNSPDTDEAAPEFGDEAWVKDETAKRSQRQKAYKEEIQAVKAYSKRHEELLDEEMDRITIDELPAHIQFASDLTKNKYKLLIAEKRVSERAGA